MLIRTIKEMARHMLHRAGVRRRFGYLEAPDRSARFANIYDQGVWRHGDADVPASGLGSTIAATESVRTALPALVARLGIESVLDLGCGDFTWMKHVPLGADYCGVDIVPSVVAANLAAFAGPTRRFLLADGVTDALPDAEFVLCREMLFHLSLADGRRLIANILSRPRRYLLITSDRGTRFNADIVTGDFRLINLERPPFHFPPPIETIRDDKVANGRILGLWATAELAKRNF